jgi:hypothetical protein
VPRRVGAQAACWRVHRRHPPDRWNHREARGGPVAARMPGCSHRPPGEGPPGGVGGAGLGGPSRGGQRRARPAFSLLTRNAGPDSEFNKFESAGGLASGLRVPQCAARHVLAHATSRPSERQSQWPQCTATAMARPRRLHWPRAAAAASVKQF